jgi:hypothetical protein
MKSRNIIFDMSVGVLYISILIAGIRYNHSIVPFIASLAFALLVFYGIPDLRQVIKRFLVTLANITKR